MYSHMESKIFCDTDWKLLQMGSDVNEYKCGEIIITEVLFFSPFSPPPPGK